MNKVSSIILASGLSTLMFVPQILAQTSNFLVTGFPDGKFRPEDRITRGDRHLTPLGIGTLDSATSPTPPVASNLVLVIESIETNTTSRQTLREGDELLVTVYGTPRASASFRLEGLNRNRAITMTEVDRGIYEGRYTIRRNDGQINSRLTVSLSQQGANSVTREFNRAIAINSSTNGNTNGNTNNSQTLKPEITNFNNNDVISLPVDLVGQTLPDANVEVTMDVLRSIIGIVDISQTVFQTTVRADGQGKFIVNLPSGNLAFGNRYRVRLTARKNNQSQSNEIFLRQN